MRSSTFLILQQDDFLSNYAGSFQDLRSSEELFDVTLACEDEVVEGHKVVLSACSPFFRNIFRQTQAQHPFIYLKGVLHKDLLAMMDYIYTGKTEVLAEEVERFCQVGKDMRINGFDDVQDDLNSSATKNKTMSENKNTLEDGKDETADVDSRRLYKVYNRALEESDNILVGRKKDNFNENSLNKDSNERFELEDTINTDQFSSNYQEESTSLILNADVDKVIKKPSLSPEEEKQNAKLQIEIEKLSKKVVDDVLGTMWRCMECEKIFKKKYKIERHVETHIKSLGFIHKCLQCDKTCTTRGSLRTHISINHRYDKINLFQ